MAIEIQEVELGLYFLSSLHCLPGPSNSAWQRYWSGVREFQNNFSLVLQVEGERGGPERVSR